jgi:C-terminal processing protease CtpA/Prc
MKRILLVLTVLALAMPALAGGGEGNYGCNADTQECLDKMVAHLQKSGYGGLEMHPDEATGELKVTVVYPDSPASRIGVKVGDILQSVAGKTMAEMTPEEHQALEASLLPGSTHDFTVLRRGKERSFSLTLEKMPAEMIEKYVGKHMMHHTNVEVASN